MDRLAELAYTARMRFTLTLLAFMAASSAALAMGDRHLAEAAPVDPITVSDAAPAVAANSGENVRIETDAPPAVAASQLECIHVCGNICVSKQTAMVSKFACRDDALEACYRVNGTCGIVAGECGWTNPDELKACQQPND